MNAFANLPLSLRVVLVYCLALATARFVNFAIYRWCYFPSQFGPWMPAPRKQRPRSWQDHIPILGWFHMRGEEDAYGRLFWLRPLLMELLFPICMVSYYQFCVAGGALPLGVAVRAIQPQMHWQFVGHYMLFTLMSIATFIDFDERSIPDAITLPGTVLGIVGSAFAAVWLPWTVSRAGIGELHCAYPLPFPDSFLGPTGLIYCLLVIGIWGFSLLNRRWITRRGLGKAFVYLFASIFRRRKFWIPPLCVSVGLMLFVSICYLQDLTRWPMVVSSCLGLGFAGGVTWAVRIAASKGLGMEALGFGDVTLMAMIGTTVGWQASLLIFFIAPLVAIVFVLVRAALTGDPSTPYGPYLCAACVIVLVWWNNLWTLWAAPLFTLGTLIVWIVLGCILLMGVLLWIWRLVKEALGIQTH